MDIRSKKLALQRLKQKIDAIIPDAWVFPTQGNVHGFLGTGPIMFVAERPATGKSGGPAFRLLYNLLEKLGVGNSHLTDIIKSRGKVGEPYPKEMGPHKRIFDLEMRIIRPRIIITFGQKVYDLLQFTLAGADINIRRVYHYAYTRRGAEKAAMFEKQLREAVRDRGKFLE